jgi:hypothetical protein
MLVKIIALILIISFFTAIFLWILIRGGSIRSEARMDERIDLKQQNFQEITNHKNFEETNPKSFKPIMEDHKDYLSVRS